MRMSRPAPLLHRISLTGCLALALMLVLGLAWPVSASVDPLSATRTVPYASTLGTQVYLPVLRTTSTVRPNGCQPTYESYSTLTVNPPPSPPAEGHPDLNLSWRGYTPVQEGKMLVDYGGASDGGAPQLPGLFSDNRTGRILSTHRVYDWDWANNQRGAPISNPSVTLIGLATDPGETIHVPAAGYSIGDGFQVLVLYAAPDRITLKYTREDNVVFGYTLHLEGLCVDANLLALYQASAASGRGRLPALRARQALGRAASSEIGVAIRDNGSFMDPRSRKDWWRGR